jgi:hypothetical protein
VDGGTIDSEEVVGRHGTAKVSLVQGNSRRRGVARSEATAKLGTVARTRMATQALVRESLGASIE